MAQPSRESARSAAEREEKYQKDGPGMDAARQLTHQRRAPAAPDLRIFAFT